ncbi:hypothetical protein Gogos_018815 [Gossypium gossypioides]|uniref:AB hydrolase-1 domain-containing protein n=1 Tax=Gossypium gossypioides TaxID=34282 RepID=A0A7J9BFI3_GOSGO|nr:hypothetical protein [Gossypium gossypioides]
MSSSSSCGVSPSVRTEILNPVSNRRGFALKGIVASGVSVMGSSLTSEPVQGHSIVEIVAPKLHFGNREFFGEITVQAGRYNIWTWRGRKIDRANSGKRLPFKPDGYNIWTWHGVERLPFKPDGYNFWTWRGRKIHYVVQGEGFPIVLIHGFGASAFHWRYNIPELAKNYKVYAIDLLGFGWSEKAIIEYDAMIWRDQVVDFLKEIVKEPTVLVGNSLGGFTALVAAVGLPEQVVGLALLNSAGQFGDAKAKTTEPEETFLQKFVLKPLKEVFQRVVLQVYINTSNVDDYLVESIKMPADDPNAGEVYYRYLRSVATGSYAFYPTFIRFHCLVPLVNRRLMTRFMLNQTEYTLDSFLSKLTCPLLLLWGDLDPWVGPAKANRIKEFYPNTTLVNLKAGHCPHDEVPELANKALVDWLSTIAKKASSLQTV